MIIQTRPNKQWEHFSYLAPRPSGREASKNGAIGNRGWAFGNSIENIGKQLAPKVLLSWFLMITMCTYMCTVCVGMVKDDKVG